MRDRLSRARARDARAEDSVDLEIRHHLDMRTDELVAEGHDAEEARRIALEAFGDLPRYRAECLSLTKRGARTTRWTDRLEGWGRDVAFAFRSIRKSPTFALTLLLMLGVGVGANTAIYTVVDAVLVRPLPYADADRLVQISPHDPEAGFTLTGMYKASALAWRDDGDIFEAQGWSYQSERVWMDGDEAKKVWVHAMTPGLMDMLGIAPLIGRSLVPEDALPGAEPVALIGEELWSRGFGRSADVLGRSIELDGRSFTIVGVMSRIFRFPITSPRDLYVGLGADEIDALDDRDGVLVIGRLPMGADTAVVGERARAFQASLVDEGVELSGFPSVRITKLDEWRTNPDTRRSLWVLMGGSAVLLLIAGLNAANLLLVRGATRRAEIGVRLALGGSRGRIVRQLTIEAVLVALLSAGLAVLIAAGTLQSILATAPQEITAWSPTPIELGGRVAAFTVALSAIVGVLFGALPLASTVRSAATSGIGELTTREAGARGRGRWRDALVVGEIALSVVLLAGAGLFVKSFVQLAHTDPGFDADGLVAVTAGAPPRQTPRSRRAARVLRGGPAASRGAARRHERHAVERPPSTQRNHLRRPHAARRRLRAARPARRLPVRERRAVVLPDAADPDPRGARVRPRRRLRKRGADRRPRVRAVALRRGRADRPAVPARRGQRLADGRRRRPGPAPERTRR